MSSKEPYVGLHQDSYGGLTPLGNIIRDAWIFGLLPEGEGCRGWSLGQLEGLYDRVAKAWEPYGHLVSQLPPELRARHERFYTEAVQRARELGWNPELEEDEG